MANHPRFIGRRGLFLVLHFGVLGIDDIAVILPGVPGRAGRAGFVHTALREL